MQLDFSGIANENDCGGLVPDGRYHAVIVNAEPHRSNSGTEGVKVTFGLLNGTTGGQAGRKVEETFWQTANERVIARFKRLVMSAKAVAPGFVGEFDMRSLIGKDLVIEVLLTKAPRSDGQGDFEKNELSFMGFWGSENPEVQQVPRGTVPTLSQPPAQAQPQASAPAQGAPAQAGGDPWKTF